MPIPRKYLWLAVPIAAVALCSPCAFWFAFTGRVPSVVPIIGDNSEAIVRAHVIENAHDPASIEFVKWGPNVKCRNSIGRTIYMVRVKLRAKNAFGAKMLQDHLYAVIDGKVEESFDNDQGDDWPNTFFGTRPNLKKL